MADNPWATLQARWEDDAEREAMERIHGEPPQATESDAEREYAHNYGMDRPDVAWVNTPRDSWEPNPHYVGPEEPHPEDDEAYEDLVAWRQARARRQAEVATEIAAFNAMTVAERQARAKALHDALEAEGDDMVF